MPDQHQVPDQPPAAAPGAVTPRPFDRSLLEATLADAARAAAADAAPARTEALPTVRPSPGVARDAAPERLATPGAQSLLSTVGRTPSPRSPEIEGRVLDAHRLRVGADLGPGRRSSDGEVTLPVVGTRPSLTPQPVTGAPPAGAPQPGRVAHPGDDSRPAKPAQRETAPGAPRGPARPVRPAQPAVPEAARAAVRPWQPSDDDILPTRAARHRRAVKQR